MDGPTVAGITLFAQRRAGMSKWTPRHIVLGRLGAEGGAYLMRPSGDDPRLSRKWYDLYAVDKLMVASILCGTINSNGGTRKPRATGAIMASLLIRPRRRSGITSPSRPLMIARSTG